MLPHHPLPADGAVVGRLRHLRGQSLVEFALILPVLLVVVLGTIDLGRAFATAVTIENAAKEGAFFGARVPECADASLPGCADPATVEGRVEADLDGVALSAFVAKCFAPGTTDFTGPGKALSDCEDGDLYYVEVASPFSLITPIVAALVGDTITLTSTATSVVITDFGDGDVTFPSVPPSPSAPPGSCTVPDFTLGPTRINGAVTVWVNIGGFQASNITTNGPNGHDIVWQSVPAGTVGPCTTQTITVSSTNMGTPAPTASPSPTPAPTPTPVGATPTPTPALTPTPTPAIQMCTVPQMAFNAAHARLTVTQAQAVWTNAGFTAANFTAVRPPVTDYQVRSQSLASGQSRPCLTTTVQVDD